MRHMNGKTTQTCLAVAALFLAAVGSGCAIPTIEGVVAARDFAIFNDVPEARGGEANDHAFLVFVDIDENQNTLRTVSVDIRALSEQPIGEVLDVGEGDIGDTRPVIDVTEGELVRSPLPDGSELITTNADAMMATSTSGVLTIDENDDELVGTFDVKLNDGGYLQGSFRSRN